MISDPQAITRTLLRPIHSRPLPRGHIDLAGLGKEEKPTREFSSWWLVCLAISAVCFAIWGLHL